MVSLNQNVRGVESGKRFGKRVVLGIPFSRGRRSDGEVDWVVVTKCDCGKLSVVLCGAIARGRSQECRSCSTSRTSLKHGDAVDGGKTKLYGVWTSMHARCENEKHAGFRNYGGRGISVCEEWNDYPKFREWATDSGYSIGLEIDRRNNDGNYEPGNCRWVTKKQNNRNRRNNTRVTAFGETKCLKEWSEDRRCVVHFFVLQHRIQDGWQPEDAISKPKRYRQSRRAARGG